MDTSSLPQLIAAPIKNILDVQRIKAIQWMNPRACTNEAYTPTPIEHVANVATHGIWVVPSIMGGLELVQRSTTKTQLVSACVYGTSLILVFAVSTFFHSVHYYNYNRQLKDALHRCDRAMIYVFIAASYFPWLNVDYFPDDELLHSMRYVVWIMAIMGILYQQVFHERYKMLETIFYLFIGIGPSVAIINNNSYYNITELKLGGIIYVFGLVFFKSDGRIPCAHAIWHLLVAAAAGFHYYAILTHIFPPSGSPDIFTQHKLLKSHIEEL
ncbi:monocyte to macrophage differentiation factor 2 isoform X1 [Hylaeus anthracinus]|uniref:monocyte to macrophage differentiation factor 2 isoform X1 n=2 Tax=Hylaeus anthracinus TaxID=313031 RepID=UPI0023BA08CA|nr:monocyte to macrophage differentiation factor 2 isoform X1 [Hylaeus anthracinus]XP_054016625.1 monocyte to macrophage differentiation factor 2 isoform X1 [Hylaeus anthracinus]